MIRPAAGGNGDGAAVVRALAEERRAVVYDLTGFVDGDGQSLAFDTIERYLTAWSGTPLLVCTELPALRQQLRRHPLGARVTTWPSLEAALAAGRRRVPADRSTLDLPPMSRAPGQARTFVRRTLVRWGYPQLLDHANLVCTELVTNVMWHAPGPMTVSLSRQTRGTRSHPLIRLAVRDTSTALPVLSTHEPLDTEGRGLSLVSVIARAWGVVPLDDGKCVWAVLDGRIRAEPASPAHT